MAQEAAGNSDVHTTPRHYVKVGPGVITAEPRTVKTVLEADSGSD